MLRQGFAGQAGGKTKHSLRLHPRPEDGAKYYHWRGQWLEGRIKNLEWRRLRVFIRKPYIHSYGVGNDLQDTGKAPL